MPTKQQVRDWMQKRQQDRTPPPSPDEIRRQLGHGFNSKSSDRQR